MSCRTPSSSCSGSHLEESERWECCPKRARPQGLDRENAHGRCVSACRVPALRGAEPPGGRLDPAPRPRPPRAAGTRPRRPERAAWGRPDRGSTLSMLALRCRRRRPSVRGRSPAALQCIGDRLRARAVGARAGDGACGAAEGQRRIVARLRRHGLGDAAAVGNGRAGRKAVRVGARRRPVGDAARGRGGRGDGARGERGLDDTPPADRAARLPRRRARGVRARGRKGRQNSAHLDGPLP